MRKIRISAVKYANTYPFIYGLKHGGISDRASLETDHPADCAAKLIDDRVDVGLIPAGALPYLREYHIISDYCIGTNGYVRTVMLLSNTPFDRVSTVYLDYRSRTSVNLVKVLACNFWNREFTWVNTGKGFDFTALRPGEASVLIGDQCFRYEKSFRYNIDLGHAWKQFTGLPFVFACWTANKKLEKDFIDDFNSSLAPGVNNIDAVVEEFGQKGIIRGSELKKYLTENIDYDFNSDKKSALKLFLDFMGKLNVKNE